MEDQQVRLQALKFAYEMFKDDFVGEEDREDYGSFNHVFEVASKIYIFLKGETPNE